eukprot:5704466-Lingulodinium_polyedra.AAC.1
MNSLVMLHLVVLIVALSVFVARGVIHKDTSRQRHARAQQLREVLGTRVLSLLGWADARAVCVDGATKGVVDAYRFHQWT